MQHWISASNQMIKTMSYSSNPLTGQFRNGRLERGQAEILIHNKNGVVEKRFSISSLKNRNRLEIEQLAGHGKAVNR